MTTNDYEKLIDKIRKLKAKADGTTNEAEAIAFMGKVQDLLVQHNIDISELDEVKEEYGMVADDQYYPTAWKRNVWGSISILYFCKVIRSRRTVKKRNGFGFKEIDTYLLVGSKTNVTVAREMIDYVIKTIERLCKEESKDHNLSRNEEYLFCNGASIRISERVDEMIMSRETQVSTSGKSNLPAIYDQELSRVNDFISENIGKTTSGRSSSMKYNKLGYDAGDKIGLGDQISGSKTAGMIK